MRRIGYNGLALAVLAAGLLASTIAFAQDPKVCPGNTPGNPNGVVIHTRLFNDCPTSVVNVVNNFPAVLDINDSVLDCFGFANKHVWHVSTDGGQTTALFENCSHYRWGASFLLSGSGGGEGGLLLSPWWSEGDGQFMANASSGEIAIFGGRLPFFSFTSAFGLHYVKGTEIYFEMVYSPHNVTQADPAQIHYIVKYNGVGYNSPWIPFDSGFNPLDPPHGTYGEMADASIGGYLQPYLGQGNPVDFDGRWWGFVYEGPGATPAVPTTWGRMKTLYR